MPAQNADSRASYKSNFSELRFYVDEIDKDGTVHVSIERKIPKQGIQVRERALTKEEFSELCRYYTKEKKAKGT